MDLSLRHLTDRILAAAADGTPLRIRGGGSKDFYGQTLQGEVLDLRPHTGIISYEPTELVVTVRAGTPLAELEAALAEQGQCLPFEPPHFARTAADGATVGGMVAAGLSGPGRASVGALRDYVLGVQIVNGKGELLTFCGQVMKNVAGYDVSRLMAGSLGTLGVIAEVSLKVLPVPPAERTLVFELSETSARQQLNRWGGQPLPLNASCWVQNEGAGQLVVRLRGAVAAVEAACRPMGGERLDNADVAGAWGGCREQTLPWFEARTAAPRPAPQPGLDLWRLSLPATAPVLPLPAAAQPLVEWHGALRWVQAPRVHAAALYEKALLAGGSASLFIAGGGQPISLSGCFAVHSAALGAIHQRLRQAFDPAGIFNPARAGAVGA